MSIDSPTLKVRIELLDDGAFWGRTCDKVADELIQGKGAVVLDSKWGRPPAKWRETGGWGRQRLTDWEAGYVAARQAMALDSGGDPLLEIIERLTGV